MKSLLEIEQNIDLPLFERELGQNGRKRTKAGKYYWYILLLNIHISEKENRTIDKSASLKSFGRIFYRDYELKVSLIENFDGMQSSELAKMDFEAADQSYKKQINQLWGELIGDLELLYEEKKELFPKGKYTKQPKLNRLYFLDKKRPKLPLVSREYRRLLDLELLQKSGQSVKRLMRLVCDLGFVQLAPDSGNPGLNATVFCYTISQ